MCHCYCFETGYISIHALHAESDRRLLHNGNCKKYFNPRSPCGERHLRCLCLLVCCYISIHALHAESDMPAGFIKQFSFKFQSTLSMRRATIYSKASPLSVAISIHALHAESDNASISTSDRREKFQSTLSMRRATTCACA